ncbi:hypothetical protein CBOM_00510 [Ceraceosorus bombacis]|uniref:Uncharacterized protein n=1 Tax=Ceraceosorus bombacis TaxID=401625 RepID=A0A0P1B9D7_9BASI|nr:hypothetical protein CBOM_00510 [Ceraceosorus bombacis]
MLQQSVLKLTSAEGSAAHASYVGCCYRDRRSSHDQLHPKTSCSREVARATGRDAPGSLFDLAAYKLGRDGMGTIKVGHRIGMWFNNAGILAALHALARDVDLLGPSAAQTRAAEDSGQVGETRGNRWDSGGWQAYGLNDGIELSVLAWQRLDEGSQGGLHIQFNPAPHHREAVLRLFDGAGVQDGRPAAVGEVNVGIANLIQQNHAHLCHLDCLTPDAPAALQRVIDMANCSSIKSVIVMKDVTAKDLRSQHHDDYGLFGLGCGQGPATFQRLLALMDYSRNKTVYDGID